MQPITEIAAKLGLQGEDVIPYGHYKAKLNHLLAKADKPEGKAGPGHRHQPHPGR